MTVWQMCKREMKRNDIWYFTVKISNYIPSSDIVWTCAIVEDNIDMLIEIIRIKEKWDINVKRNTFYNSSNIMVTFYSYW